MSFFHGVTVTNVDIGARTIALPASSVIGLCDVFTPGAQASAKPNVPVLLTSKKDAAAAFGIGSSIYLACEAIYNRAQAVIVAVGVEAAETPEAQASAVIGGVSAAGERTGLQALLDGKSRFNAQPRLLVAPGHSAQQAVATAMDGLAEKLRAIAILDGPNSTDEAAVAYAKNFGSKRLFMVDPGVQVWDSATNAARNAPASAYAAGLFAWTDAEYGFWSSPSNKEIKGITGTSRPVEFLDGDETCRANLLNNANIATIIRDDGYRLWGQPHLVQRQQVGFRHPRSDHGPGDGCDPRRTQVGGGPRHHQDLREGCHRGPARLHARSEEPGRGDQLRGLCRPGPEQRQPAGPGQGVLEHPLHRCAACREPQFPCRGDRSVAHRSSGCRLRSARDDSANPDQYQPVHRRRELRR